LMSGGSTAAGKELGLRIRDYASTGLERQGAVRFCAGKGIDKPLLRGAGLGQARLSFHARFEEPGDYQLKRFVRGGQPVCSLAIFRVGFIGQSGGWNCRGNRSGFVHYLSPQRLCPENAVEASRSRWSSGSAIPMVGLTGARGISRVCSIGKPLRPELRFRCLERQHWTMSILHRGKGGTEEIEFAPTTARWSVLRANGPRHSAIRSGDAVSRETRSCSCPHKQTARSVGENAANRLARMTR